MTDLIQVLPDLDTQPYSHLLPSLEKALITTNDLLTLDALDVAKRAQLPPAEVRKLADYVLHALHLQLGVGEEDHETSRVQEEQGRAGDSHPEWATISTLDDDLDVALGGGFPAGYLTEITGERYLLLVYSRHNLLTQASQCRR